MKNKNRTETPYREDMYIDMKRSLVRRKKKNMNKHVCP